MLSLEELLFQVQKEADSSMYLILEKLLIKIDSIQYVVTILPDLDIERAEWEGMIHSTKS